MPNVVPSIFMLGPRRGIALDYSFLSASEPAWKRTPQGYAVQLSWGTTHLLQRYLDASPGLGFLFFPCRSKAQAFEQPRPLPAHRVPPTTFALSLRPRFLFVRRHYRRQASTWTIDCDVGAAATSQVCASCIRAIGRKAPRVMRLVIGLAYR
jgi:hypothetical protein